MADSILKRLLTLFKAKSHDALDAVEDPAALARQMARDLASELDQTEEVVAELIGEHTVLSSKLAESQTEATTWKAKARMALQAIPAREDLATQAMQRANLAVKQSEAYRQTLSLLTPRVEKVKAKLVELRAAKAESDSESLVLTARVRAAGALDKAARLLGGIGETPVDFERVRDQVDLIEAKSDAMNTLAEEKSGEDLEKKFAALQSAGSMSQQLEELRLEIAAKGGE